MDNVLISPNQSNKMNSSLILKYNILYISASKKSMENYWDGAFDSLVKPLARLGMLVNPIHVSVEMDPVEQILQDPTMNLHAIFIEETVNKGMSITSDEVNSNKVNTSKLDAKYLGTALRMCKMKYFPAMKLVLVLKDKKTTLQNHGMMQAYARIYDGALGYPMQPDTVADRAGLVKTHSRL